MSILGDNLRQRRLELDMSQEEVAAMINKSRESYNKYETGGAKPDIDTLILLAEIYKTSIDALTGRDIMTMIKAGYRMGYKKGDEIGEEIIRKRATKRSKKAKEQ